MSQLALQQDGCIASLAIISMGPFVTGVTLWYLDAIRADQNLQRPSRYATNLPSKENSYMVMQDPTIMIPGK